MATQFISTNKNYKRLYNAPLDPSLVWDDINELREYLKDPTCYLNMIVGCSGKAYIIVEKNGVKGVSDRDIHFDIHRDSYGIAELTSVIINDILIGGAK